MIDATPSPKPLPQNRLGQLMNGLQARMTGGLQATAAQVEELEQQIVQLGGELESRQQGVEADYAIQKDTTQTAWDDLGHQNWDQAELKTFKAIYETAEREKRLKSDAQAKIEHATQEAKKKISEIEAKFLKAKEAPLQRLRNFRNVNNDLKDKLGILENQAAAALAKRSLGVPHREDADHSGFISTLQTAREAYNEFTQAFEEAKQQADRITNNKLAKFVESAFFWIFSFIFFVGTAAVLVSMQIQEMIPAVITAAGATVGLVVISFLGIRPWLKSSAKREYPKLTSLLDKGEQVHRRGEELAMKENEEELNLLAEKRDKKYKKTQKWRDDQVEETQTELQQVLTELRKKARESKYAAQRMLTDNLARTNSDFEQRVESERMDKQYLIEKNLQEHESSTQALKNRIYEIDQGGAHRLRVATEKAVQSLTRSREWSTNHFPSWKSFSDPQENWPEGLLVPQIPLGNLIVKDVLPAVDKLKIDKTKLEAPVIFSPLQDDYLVVHGKASNPAVQRLVRNVLMRALTTLPAGRTQVCVVDPPGLGQDFGWLMHLGDFDAQLVSHRVWTQPAHIGKQMQTLALAAEDFIQQSLRNEYQNIVQYNADAGALAEPFRILVWSSMPNGMDDHSWKSLKSLLDSGARCGIIPILIVDPDESWPYSDQESTVNRKGLHVNHVGGERFSVKSEKGPELFIESPEAPDDELAQTVVKEIGRRSLLSNRVEVPLERMVPAQGERWQADSSSSLEIPIGQSGVGRTHCLKLGIGTAQHAIIAGKTGSGKSSLLHALITSAMMKYSPEALRLVLLDFKKGVEFQVYSDTEVPHADIIGIESHREFGLSALEYVDGCLQRRGEMFRAASVQDIASWNALHPDDMLPRMMVVVDEFQEIFVEDDKLSGAASLILDRIVRQGRSFGVHAILSSQTLAGSYSLPRTTLGQMAVRIALQCDASDAQIIFAEDNPAASRLKHPGQAVYNDAGGRIEGNQPMQIGWLPKEHQVKWFQEQAQGYRNDDASTNLLGRTVIYDGNRAATWTDVNADMAIEQACKEVNPDAIWGVAGESVAINPAVVYPLTRQSGRNVLIVGGEDPQASAVQNAAVASFVRSSGTSAKVYAIQGAKPTDSRALSLPKSWADLDCELKAADMRDTDAIIGEVHKIVQDRTEGDDDADQTPVLLSLIQIGRLRSLRREDDFASFGESEATPDKQLEEILRDGPSVGVHCMIWAESYSTVNRWLSRNSLREIEIRMLMQMSANDSTNLVDSIAASRLGDHVMLLFDEATGQEQRFRPFNNDSLSALPAWSKKTL
ncbi:MAG: FtsK/SpoIIIE domain-containing protein [Planctomycetota bacterium]